MSTQRANAGPATFDGFASYAAILAGIVGVLYSFSFVVLVAAGKAPALGMLLSALFLMLGGLLSSAALVAVFNHVSEAGPALGIWGVMLALMGQLGAVIHGGYDLANVIHPPAANALNLADLPSQIDPRGLLTFGIAGLGLFALSILITRSGQFPQALGKLGYALASLLMIIYLGRLIILNPANPIVAVLIVVTGFVINPIWYIWLGIALAHQSST